MPDIAKLGGLAMSSTTRGYIQYCPDPSRLEAVNIGVALYCPDLPFLRARFGRCKTRVQQILGQQDWEFVDAQRIALEARLSRRDEEFSTLEGFESFVAKRASAFRLTPPRPVKVEGKPEQELLQLFTRLVGPQSQSKQNAEKLISTELESRFRAAGVERLKSNVTVHPPSLPRPFRAPFAYRNGRLNLIEPVQFEGHSLSGVFNRASVHAVEGQFLADYTDPTLGKLGLVVVGKFSPEQEEEKKTAIAVFKSHHVPMHTFSTLELLIEEIKRYAHD
jgi:hypothetical protein